MPHAKPKCPKCKKTLRKSKLDINGWVCKNCNECFKTQNIDIKGTWYEAYVDKRIYLEAYVERDGKWKLAKLGECP